jgi:hypothetical protein
MKISLAIHLLLFHAALVRPSSCLFVINTATSIAFELLDRPIVHGSQLIHAIVPVPPKATPADMILIKQELEGVDERYASIF